MVIKYQKLKNESGEFSMVPVNITSPSKSVMIELM